LNIHVLTNNTKYNDNKNDNEDDQTAGASAEDFSLSTFQSLSPAGSSAKKRNLFSRK
jgi:hypothetical protein